MQPRPRPPPVRASRLNQPEIYHSIIQRKVPDPNDFLDTAAVARALTDFEHRYNQIAAPLVWNFTRADLAALLDRLDQRDQPASTSATDAPRHPASPPETDGDYDGQH